jgi:hypothetical protein
LLSNTVTTTVQVNDTAWLTPIINFILDN